jgi:hypothetical protein
MTYRLDATSLRLYDRYIPEFVQALGAAFQRWGEIPGMQRKLEIRERLLRAWNRARGTLRYARYRIG